MDREILDLAELLAFAIDDGIADQHVGRKRASIRRSSRAGSRIADVAAHETS